MLHLQARVAYNLARLAMAEQERKAARRYLGRLARELSRRDIPMPRDGSALVGRFPFRRRIVDYPSPAAT